MMNQKNVSPFSNFRKILFFSIFKYNLPGAKFFLWWITTKREYDDFMNFLISNVDALIEGEKLLKEYIKISPVYAQWLTHEKFDLLPGHQLGGFKGLVNLDGLFGDPEKRLKLFTILVVDDETFYIFFSFLLKIEHLVQTWGYVTTDESSRSQVWIAEEEEEQFSLRFAKELAYTMSRTRQFTGQFDQLYALFQHI